MNAKRKNIKSNLKKVDKHSIKEDEYDDLPELTDEMLERATYKVGGVEKPAPRRRGAQKSPTKVVVNVRLPRAVVEYFKEEGAGWQTKMGDALTKWMKAHPHR